MNPTRFVFLLALPAAAVAQPTLGLIHSDTNAQPGYTLFAPLQSKQTYLIDECGYQVNEWSSNYTPGLSVYLNPDGLLSRASRDPQSEFAVPGYGGIIEFFDWHGALVRTIDASSNAFCQHHDFKLLPNGNVLVLGWEYVSHANALAAGRLPANLDSAGIWPEAILEYELFPNDSEAVVWEWHVWDHLTQTNDSSAPNYGPMGTRPRRIDVNYFKPTLDQRDWLHANAIDYNAELDQILISVLAFDEIWIIDHSTTSAEAASDSGGVYGHGGDLLYRYGNSMAYGRGTVNDQKFFGQHNPTWIPKGYPNEGKLLVFNNNGGPDGLTSVEMMVPPTTAPGVYFLPDSLPWGPDSAFWKFSDPDLHGPFVSGAQAQPNGNVLICLGPSGDFWEVDTNGVLRWQYVNPVNTVPDTQGSPTGYIVFRAERYPPDFAGFNGKTLESGAPIELNPVEYDCAFDDELDTANALSEIRSPSSFFLTTSAGTLHIRERVAYFGQYDLFDLQGRHILSFSADGEHTSWPLHHLLPGIYLVRKQSDVFTAQRFILIEEG